MRPCADHENHDPNDWFISKDGKQYPDDDLLTDDDRLAILEAANEQGLEGQVRVEFIEKAEDRAEVDAKKAALQRRRHAREKCHTDCYFRTQCLGQALDGEQSHGTWGGYYEEELRQIRLEIGRRKRARRGSN
jgi:hypothetical protein